MPHGKDPALKMGPLKRGPGSHSRNITNFGKEPLLKNLSDYKGESERKDSSGLVNCSRDDSLPAAEFENARQKKGASGGGCSCSRSRPGWQFWKEGGGERRVNSERKVFLGIVQCGVGSGEEGKEK